MKLQLPDGTFRAYLFDCDGTIADSMPLHFIAWKKTLKEWGCNLDEGLFYSWGGRPVKESLYYEQLPQLKAIPEVLEHIEAQHGRIPFAVVSGSRRTSVVGSLTTLNLLHKFDTIVSAEDYKNGKPAPDAYLLAADRLGVPPEDCLVFEDTEIGIQAATAAGMASVLVPPPSSRKWGTATRSGT
jgi:HAD superfamily hydrolase (TIGR01509 family)